MKRFSASGERVRLACWLRCPAATNFPEAFFATDLKLGRFPSPSSLTLATLPSMSLIPSAPFTDLHGSIGFVSIRVHSWLQLALRPVASSDLGRADQRNHLAFVPAVNAKILVGCNRAVVRIKLAHPDQTKIGQIGLLVGITFGQYANCGR